jgi:hypothetical protein
LWSLLTFRVSISFQLDYWDRGRGIVGVCRIFCVVNQDNSKAGKTDYLLANTVETNSLAYHNYYQEAVGSMPLLLHVWPSSFRLPWRVFLAVSYRLFCFTVTESSTPTVRGVDNGFFWNV